MVVVLEPSAAELDAIQRTLETDGGLTSDGFATGPLPGDLDDPNDPNQVILSLGGIASDGTVIPTSLHIENFDRVAVFQQQLLDAGIEGGSLNFNTLVRTFDQNRNDNLRPFDPDDPNIDEVAELFVGTDLVAASEDLGNVTLLQPSTEQLDAIQANLESDAGGLTVDNFATGTVPRELEDIGNPNQVILSLGGVASDGTVIPPSLQIENLARLATFQEAITNAGIEPGSETFNTLGRTFDQNRNGVLREFDPDAAADVSQLFAGTDLLDGAGGGNDDAGGGVAEDGGAGDDVANDNGDAGDDAGAGAGDDGGGNDNAGDSGFILLDPSAEQVRALEAQFNEPDADIDSGDGRSIVTRQGFLVTSEVPDGFDVDTDQFAVVTARDGFPSTLILGQNVLIAPFIAGLDAINIQQEPGLLNSLFDQTRNGGGSNIRDVDPNDLDEVADLFVGSDLLEAGPDAGRITAVDPSPEEFDAILESLEEDGGLTPVGSFAVAPLPRALENTDEPDPNQVVLTPPGTTSDGQAVPAALFVENLGQVAVFIDALEEAGISGEALNNLVNNVFNPLRNDQLAEFDADAAGDISTLFAGADIVDGGALGGDAGAGDDDVVVDDDTGNDDAGDDVANDNGGAGDDAGAGAGDDGGGNNVGNAGAGGAEFIAFTPNAAELSIIREDLELGITAGRSVDGFAVGEIPEALRGASNEVLVTEGGTDAEGNEVPPSLLFDPAVLQRQANIRIALEETFDDPETRNLLQRQFDQIRNDNLSPLEVGDDVRDVTAIFDGLDLPDRGGDSGSTLVAANDNIIGGSDDADSITGGGAGEPDASDFDMMIASITSPDPQDDGDSGDFDTMDDAHMGY